jgi:hypothetical protein
MSALFTVVVQIPREGREGSGTQYMLREREEGMEGGREEGRKEGRSARQSKTVIISSSIKPSLWLGIVRNIYIYSFTIRPYHYFTETVNS